MFSRGGDSLVIPMSLHARNRERLESDFPLNGRVIVVKGGSELPLYDTDTYHDFRQESYFHWLFGVKEPGCLGILENDKSILLVPRLPKEYQAWMGPIKSLEWFKETYLVDSVRYTDELEELVQGKRLVYIRNHNLDSGSSAPVPHLPDDDVIAGQTLGDSIDVLRSVKTPEEVRVLQFVNNVTCRAHIDVMQKIFSGTFGRVQEMEHFAETVFRFGCALQGCSRVGYNCIACAGERNAILHYGHPAEPNNNVVPRNCMRLLDMGAEYHCYTADVTNTFPTSGKYSDMQKAVYLCVWETVVAVERKLKPGVSYRDMHRYAQRVLLEQMMERTDIILSNDIEGMVSDNLIARLFMPHGLGHMLGLNVHDVGGYTKSDPRDKSDVSLTGLRLGKTLRQGMVITVEPGIYFID